MAREAGVQETVERIYRSESRRVYASLVRLLGDFELAEDALHEAFSAALAQWERDGVPANPRAWLVSTGRFKALDALRRKTRFDARLSQLAAQLENAPEPVEIEDDRLRLVFTCCHPEVPFEAQVALTLREVCGLTTEQIASAFLLSPPTLAQRIVRAKARIREARLPFEVPARDELPERLAGVLKVVYLVFNEGYSDCQARPDLSEEAIHLGRMLAELLPEPEVLGLLALMLLNESRREARSTPDGDVVLLEHQDRGLWNQALIAECLELVDRAIASRSVGAYTLQAAISAVHARAATAADTDWARIVTLYGGLLVLEPSPVVELNRAVALAMRDGPAAGLEQVDRLLGQGSLANYHLAHAARADLCRRLGRTSDAAGSYRRALELTRLEPERRYFERRLRELT